MANHFNKETAPPRPAGCHIAYIVTSALTATHLLRGQLAHVATSGFETVLISSQGKGLASVAKKEGVRVETVPMHREIAPFRDLLSLVSMWRALRRIRPLSVNASTPKAALLGLLAARALGIPIRIYTVRGLRLETARSFKRWLLKISEKTALRCATDIFCVSTSLLEKIVELDLAPPDRLRVLASGSSNGVDHRRFSESANEARAADLRHSLALSKRDFVVGFVGRLTRDKGIADLVAAFDRIRESHSHCKLLVVGDPEDGDPLPGGLFQRMTEDSRITLRPWTGNIEEYYPLMDVLAFPSYREGFPNAPLEAACAGVPTVAYRVTGSVDAVADTMTGLLVDRGDVDGLAASITSYLERPDLRQSHGEQARKRAIEKYRREVVWDALTSEYRRLLDRHQASRTDDSRQEA